MTTTKQRILDTAERLFAEHGFAATSLRAITAAAKVNLAAVHYHFGSKLGLWQAVFARRIGPINAARMAALAALDADPAPALEQVIEAFLRPALQLARSPGSKTFMRLAGRAYTEPGAHWAPVVSQFEDVKDRLLASLCRAVPGLDPSSLRRRVHFMIGVMSHTLADTQRWTFLSGSTAAIDHDVMLAHLVAFLAAGFRADVPAEVGP